MTNFIISLNDEQADLGVAKPFLYKLKQERRVRFLHAKGSIEEKLEAAYITIKKFLSIRPANSWNVLFLFDVPSEGLNPIADSVSAKWLMIRKIVLERLYEFSAPKQVSLLMLDDISNRPALPFQEERYCDQCFEFDSYGFFRQGGTNFIDEKALQALEDIWLKADINIKNENVSSIEHVSAALCQKAWKAFNAISERFLVALEHAQLDQYRIRKHFHLLDEKRFDHLKDDYIRQIQYLKEHPIEWGHFSPTATLRKVAKKYLSLFTDLNVQPFHLLRIELDRSERNAASIFKLRMALLINLLIGPPKLIKELDRNTAYQVKMHLNTENLSELTSTYRESMHYLDAYLPKQKGLPLTYSLQWRENPDLDCTDKLHDSNLKSAQLNLFRTNRSDYQDLEDWLQINEDKLLSLEEQIPEILSRCYKKSSQKAPEYSTKEVSAEEVESLEKKTNKIYAKEKNALSNVLSAEGLISKYQNKTKERLPELKKLLLKRPSLKIVLWSVLGVFLVLNLPLIIDIIENGEEAFNREMLLTFAFSLILVAAAFYYVVILVQQKIKRLLTYIFSDAQEVKRQFVDQFNSQKDYLSKLLQLNTIRNNKLAIEQLQAQIQEERLQLDYHRNALSEHKMLSSKLSNLFESNETVTLNHKRLDSMSLDLDKPDFKNKSYWLDSFAQQSYEGKLHTRIQLAERNVQFNYAKLIHTLEFKEDSLF